MTRRTSEVAVCCSNDSESSQASRAALASSPAADQRRGRAVPRGRFGAAGLRRRDLVEPALERPFMAFSDAREAHGSGSDLHTESVGKKLNQKVASGRLMSDFTLEADSCTAAV